MQGYIKLTDFGLSKVLDKENRTMSICGTSEYLAPEMIKKIGYGPDVDWWCLGCLIYEMTTGYPPFESPNRMDLFEQIVYKTPSWKGVPLFPSSSARIWLICFPNCCPKNPRSDWATRGRSR